MIKAIIFVTVSLGITFISWESFHNPRSHGFWRFFAFESFLLLILLNSEIWFRDPFSALQIISWLFLLSSFLLAVSGFFLLYKAGNPKGGIENTTALVTRGVYKHIRHPLYGSLLLGGCGVFLKDPSLPAVSLFLLTSFFVVATARVEEAENLKKFGVSYSAYMIKSKMFVPYLF